MDFTALDTFLAICETGSVTAAAQRLNCVQSAVTARLRRLEDSLGAALVERHARGVRPTEAGERLATYARRIGHLAEEARAAVRAADSPARLHLGTMETTAAVRLPPVLAQLRARHPGLRLSLATGPSDDLVREVLAGRLDAALIGGRIEHPELAVRALLSEELVEVSAAGADAPRHTLLAFRRGCTYRARAEAWLRQGGHAPFEVMEFGSLDAIVGCAAIGLGIAVLPRVVAEARGEALALAALPPEFARLETCLVRRRDLPVPAAVTELCAIMEGGHDGA